MISHIDYRSMFSNCELVFCIPILINSVCPSCKGLILTPVKSLAVPAHLNLHGLSQLANGFTLDWISMEWIGHW